MGELRVLGREGDVKTIWNKDAPAEVEAARNTFNELKAKGYIAYSVEDGGGRGKRIFDFVPEAGRIVMAPQMTGG